MVVLFLNICPGYCRFSFKISNFMWFLLMIAPVVNFANNHNPTYTDSVTFGEIYGQLLAANIRAFDQNVDEMRTTEQIDDEDDLTINPDLLATKGPTPLPVYPTPHPVTPRQHAVYPTPHPVYPTPHPRAVYSTPRPGKKWATPRPVYPTPHPVYPAPRAVYPTPRPVSRDLNDECYLGATCDRTEDCCKGDANYINEREFKISCQYKKCCILIGATDCIRNEDCCKETSTCHTDGKCYNKQQYNQLIKGRSRLLMENINENDEWFIIPKKDNQNDNNNDKQNKDVMIYVFCIVAFICISAIISIVYYKRKNKVVN